MTEKTSCPSYDAGEFEKCAGYRELNAKVNGNYAQDEQFREATNKKLDKLESGQDKLRETLDKVKTESSGNRKITVQNGRKRVISIDEATVDLWNKMTEIKETMEAQEKEKAAKEANTFSGWFDNTLALYKANKAKVILIILPVAIATIYALYSLAQTPAVQWLLEQALKIFS